MPTLKARHATVAAYPTTTYAIAFVLTLFVYNGGGSGASQQLAFLIINDY